MRPSAAADIATINRISAVPAILQVVTEMTGMRFAAVARVTPNSWTACAVLDNLGFGLKPGGELDLVTTLCFESMNSQLPILIDKASEDPQYHDHPTPRIYRFESYFTIPVYRTDGRFFGSLCALDPEPATLKNTSIQATLESFSRLLSLQIEAEENLEQAQSELALAREHAELREQFIAVLGHDLRNPLFAMTTAADRLLCKYPNPQTHDLVQHIKTCGLRASQLVEDVLDFARGRLGSGIPVLLSPCPDLAQVLEHVICEVRHIYPERQINSAIGSLQSIECDSSRLAQLLSNLLANAIAHGSASGPVHIAGATHDGMFTLSVTNQGKPIPKEALQHLFQPYSRPASNTPQAGLGLGLYIASEIALSHNGRLSVLSDELLGTTFTFTMPLSLPPEA